MQYNKPAITVAEQIKLLESRGLIIEDKEVAAHFLSNVSYYRLAGYWWSLQSDKSNHIFKEKAKFQTVINIYNFDRELRLLVFNVIERIEIGIRTRLIYHLSLTYGSHWLEDKSLFKNKRYWQKHTQTIEEEIKRSREVFIAEHKHKYNSDYRCPPAWKTLEVISLGLLSKLFENLHNSLPEKKKIVKSLFVGNHTFLASWLRSIAIVRNICAHHSRLWNRNLPTPPKLLTHAALPWITTPKEIDGHSFYAVFICLYYLLQTISPNNQFKIRFKKLFKKYPNIDSTAMGFPDDWEDEPIWNQ